MRRNRAVDAAGERDEHTLLAQRPRRRGDDRMPERHREGIGREIGGVELAGREPAEFVGDGLRIDTGHVEHGLPIGEGDHGAAGGLRRAAPAGLEADRRDALAVGGERDADQVAAGGAAGDADVRSRRRASTPGRMLKVLGEPLIGHRMRVRATWRPWPA